MKVTLLIPALALAFAALSAPCAAENPKDRFPFFPSLINSNTGGPISADRFLSPSECRGCHGELYNQWRGSMHSLARRDPVFLALWEKGAKEAGQGVGTLCAGCHAAPAVLAGEVKLRQGGDFDLPATADAGVSCHVCHSIVATAMTETPTGLPQNASIVFDPGLTMRGPYKDSNPMWHKAEYSELHTKAEFCGNCHNVFHPVSNFRIENTYTEWKDSVYAEKGIICQDCHMMPVEKAIEAAKTLTRPKNPGYASKLGPARENVFTHEFVGANYTVPTLSGYPAKAEIAKKRLKSAAELELSLPAQSDAGQQLKVIVRVKNIGAGHNLPTSLTEVRQLWLEASATDATGTVVALAGAPDKDGELPADAVTFGSVTLDSEGKHTLLPWKMDSFGKFNTIPPKGHSDAELTLPLPASVKGPIVVTATLRYRSYPQKLARDLLGPGAPLIEIVDMTAAKATVEIK